MIWRLTLGEMKKLVYQKPSGQHNRIIADSQLRKVAEKVKERTIIVPDGNEPPGYRYVTDWREEDYESLLQEADIPIGSFAISNGNGNKDEGEDWKWRTLE